MKLFTLTIFTFLTINLSAQNLSEALLNRLSDLTEAETIEMKYAKTGCWGTYEGGHLTFTALGDSIQVELTNQQNYLDAKSSTTISMYDKEDLFMILAENKNSFAYDPNNIVLANSFDFKLFKNQKEVASGSSLLEPRDVLNKVSLSNGLLDSFLKNQKGILKNSGVFKGPGINN